MIINSAFGADEGYLEPLTMSGLGADDRYLDALLQSALGAAQDTHLQAVVPFEGYLPHEHLTHYVTMAGALGWGFPNPIKAVKNIGKGAGKAIKSAGRAVGDVGEAIGKGFIAAGKYTVKIGGKVVDVALLPFTVMLKLSKKIAGVLCSMPPATFAAAASAGSAAAGAPMNPQQSAQFRRVFCSVAAALEAGRIKNAKDLANFKKMLPVAMKIGTTGMQMAQQQTLRSMQAGAQQKMAESGLPPAAQEAAQQMIGVEEIDKLFDEGAKTMRKLPNTKKRAFNAGAKMASSFLSRQGKSALSNLTAQMTAKAAAGQLAAKIPGFEARVNAEASLQPARITQALTSKPRGLARRRGRLVRRKAVRRPSRSTRTRSTRPKRALRATELVAARAAIKRLESMGRKAAADRIRRMTGLSGAPPRSGVAVGVMAGTLALFAGVAAYKAL